MTVTSQPVEKAWTDKRRRSARTVTASEVKDFALSLHLAVPAHSDADLGLPPLLILEGDHPSIPQLSKNYAHTQAALIFVMLHGTKAAKHFPKRSHEIRYVGAMSM